MSEEAILAGVKSLPAEPAIDLPAIPPVAPVERSAQLVRQRLVRVMTCGFLTSFAIEGIIRILPLYLTQMLGANNATVARALSLRMWGIVIGVILLGAFGDRFGTKRLTMLALAGGGVCTALLGVVPLRSFLMLLMLLSALLSTAFVNLNHLTQLVDERRQGMANTLYRTVNMLAAVLAPLVVTRLLGLIAGVFCAMGLGLVVAAFGVRRYPLEEPRETFRGWRGELQGALTSYRAALAERRLMWLLHLSSLWLGSTSVVLTFFAIRLTKELGASTGLYGNACALGAGLSLAGILALGFVLDRVSLKRCVTILSLLGAGCVTGLGLSQTGLVNVMLFVVFTACSGMWVAPVSMWISREAQNAGLGAAFSMQKVLMTAYPAVMMLLFGSLESRLGIRLLLLTAGGVSVFVSGWLGLLPAPPQLGGGGAQR